MQNTDVYKRQHGKAIQDNDSYVLQENDADEFTNQSIRSQILPGIALGNDVESREGSFTAVSYTHLDVYKRQASRLFFRGHNEIGL